MDSRNRLKRDRSNVENELKYRQNKRILNEGLQSLSLSQYTAITDDIDEDLGGVLYKADDQTHVENIKTRSDSECTVDSVKSNEDASQTHAPEEEHLISVLKGGQVKYLRKVDFLVDDLIRKTHRTEVSKLYCPKEFDSKIPSTTGPSPTLDHILSNPLWPVKLFDSAHLLNSPNDAKSRWVIKAGGDSNAVDLHGDHQPEASSFNSFEDSDYESDDDVDNSIRGYTVHHLKNNARKELAQGVKSKLPCTLAGDSTHSDWGIQDVGSRSGQAPQQSFSSGQWRGQSSVDSDAMDAEEEQEDLVAHKSRVERKYSDSVMGDSAESTCSSSNVSNVSNVSTLSNLSAPRVPYYIDADDHVYFRDGSSEPANSSNHSPAFSGVASDTNSQSHNAGGGDEMTGPGLTSRGSPIHQYDGRQHYTFGMSGFGAGRGQASRLAAWSVSS